MDIKELTNKIEIFGKDHPTYWSNALAGEVGEFGELVIALFNYTKLSVKTGSLCNLLKKVERDNILNKRAFADEMADMFIYLALLAKTFNLDLEKVVLDKLEVIKEKRKNVGK
jgi:NTP pyrophosphatase (non-canonical NTP hydrolase)